MTTEPTNLRAGPALDFPVVDSIPDDARVTVHGCVRAYRWCDISWRDARGWVSGDELAYFYQQRYVPVVEYGPRIGLPIVVFSFDTYWDRYYRGRPFYGERTVGAPSGATVTAAEGKMPIVRETGEKARQTGRLIVGKVK